MRAPSLSRPRTLHLPGGKELDEDTLASGFGIIVGRGQFDAGDGDCGGGEEGEGGGEFHGSCNGVVIAGVGGGCCEFEKDLCG